MYNGLIDKNNKNSEITNTNKNKKMNSLAEIYPTLLTVDLQYYFTVKVGKKGTKVAFFMYFWKIGLVEMLTCNVLYCGYLCNDAPVAQLDRASDF